MTTVAILTPKISGCRRKLRIERFERVLISIHVGFAKSGTARVSIAAAEVVTVADPSLCVDSLPRNSFPLLILAAIDFPTVSRTARVEIAAVAEVVTADPSLCVDSTPETSLPLLILAAIASFKILQAHV